MEEPVKLTREIEVTEIPLGSKAKLAAGTEVRVTQALGGTYTVVTEYGNMVRIESKDADAIGHEVPAPSAQKDSADAPLEKQVISQLKTCYDPEIPVNIYDLGLVYGCQVTPLEDGQNRVDIRMTLTAPGCGMGGVLASEVKSKVEGLPNVKEANVELVWEPPWDQSRISDAAKLQLGMM